MTPGAAADVAIVGMAGRFAGADTVTELWRSLLDGREAIRELSPAEQLAGGVPERLLADPSYLPYGAPISGLGEFDAAFFGMTPTAAAQTDPQHRLFLECALRGLEDAGTPRGGRTGVFASAGPPSYLLNNLLPGTKFTGADLPHSLRMGNQVDFLAARTCYALDLTGPAVAVQTACSSSLVGVDAACAALNADRCDVAIAGAASVRLPQPCGYVYVDGGVWSADGHCRPFDAESSGWTAGAGASVVVLKRLSDALADRDRIYAVIRGIGITNDGADKMSFLAPSTSGQIAAVTQAIRCSGMPSTAVGYVEAHGTGTRLGDPIEVAALAAAYQSEGGVAAGCGLGSVKANLGHLDAAAGVTSLIKTALVLYHQIIPPQINFTRANPLLRLERTDFTIYDQAVAGPLRAAAVSSLGMGGTNVHLVLAALTGLPPRAAPAERDYQLVLSARQMDDLPELARDLDEHLATHDVRVDDLAYSLACRSAPGNADVVLWARTIAAARSALRRYADDPVPATGEPVTVDLPEAVKVPLPGQRLRPERHWIDPPSTDPDQPVLEAGGALLERVVGIFRRHIGLATFGADDTFDSTGADSMTAMEIVDTITDEIGPAISLGRFFHLRTARLVTEEIRTWPGVTRADPMLVQLSEGPPGSEIFCLHPANGTVFCYQKMVQHTTFDNSVYAIGYPFDESDPPETIPAMAARYLTEIQRIVPSGPYRLAGYSLGANIAVELASQLEAAGERVTDILLIDGLPPETYPREWVPEDYLRAAPVSVAYLLGLPLPAAEATTVDEAVDLLRQQTWSLRTVETIRGFVRMLLRSGRALATGFSPPPVRADITLLWAAEQHNPVYDAVGIRSVGADVWQKATTGRLTVVELPGNHYTLYSDPANFRHLVAALDRTYAVTPD